MSVLVVDAAGEVGARLVQRLLRDGERVVATRRRWTARNRHGLAAAENLVVAELAPDDAAACAALLDRYAPAAIVHRVPTRGLRRDGEARVVAAQRVLAACTNLLEAARGAQLRYVQAVSPRVHGQTAAVDAHTPPRPRGPVGAAHAAALALAQVYRAQLGVAACSVIAPAPDDVVDGVLRALRADAATDVVLGF